MFTSGCDMRKRTVENASLINDLNEIRKRNKDIDKQLMQKHSTTTSQ